LLEYAYGYALNNWQFVYDPKPDVIEYDNNDVLPPSGVAVKRHIENIRMFNGCTDEAGFILMHIAIVTQTNKLV
jgi:hypothetical protein